MCLCLGPQGSGKTLLLKRLQNQEIIDITSNPTPTVGINLAKIKLNDEPYTEITVREVGGSMAPIWKNYFNGTSEIMYVVDTSNLCQIAAAGTMLYGILADPLLKRARILLVLTKMDVSYRQMRNEALLMLQMARLKKELGREITVLEASAMTGEGAEEIIEWLRGKKKAKSNANKSA
ncbi:ADP-ribosylation factor-like protein 16 [Neocloeon triangulifer]|uniref:ADP-ribosylation factor-like protein 16 n=1 Tax=Neocloeon triangulifer TaxID=2078957 RepID=UPI00286ED414|nr:ADP-ribosylation factor-like protein 16 [Neocloeon triangulifer]